MRALSEILNAVIFCFGGTPAFLNISMCFSLLCQSQGLQQKHTMMIKTTKAHQQLYYNHGFNYTSKTWTYARLTVVSDICVLLAHSHLSPSSHSKLPLTPSLDWKISLPKLWTPETDNSAFDKRVMSASCEDSKNLIFKKWNPELGPFYQKTLVFYHFRAERDSTLKNQLSPQVLMFV